jgi:enoyl reductase-like protein
MSKRKTPTFKINLDAESVVNKRTGQVESPSEFVANLRDIEARIQVCDLEITEVAEHLKTLKAQRENAVAALRTAVRDGTVLPLLEAMETTEADDAPPAA